MLAFVTVGPIMYLWDLYAQWSKRLNRQMLSAWAEGNSIASQSLSHVRTVKAFGTEEQEIGSYRDANKEALRAGVKDAWGNGKRDGADEIISVFDSSLYWFILSARCCFFSWVETRVSSISLFFLWCWIWSCFYGRSERVISGACAGVRAGACSC